MQALVKIEDLSIIVTTREEWITPGEYRIPGHAVISFICDDDKYLESVQDVGASELITVVGEEGLIYKNPTVTLVEIPIPVVGD